MTDIDLEINNYEFDELLNLFSIPNNFDKSNFNIVNEKLEKIKRVAPKYYDFFYRASKIIIFIYDFNDQDILISSDIEGINKIIEKIRRIERFESYTTNDIIDKLDYNYLKRSKEMTNIRKPNIQEQIKTNHIYNSFPNAVAPGSLNSIKRLTQFLNLNLNTCFRSNYYNSNPCDFLYNIPTEVKNVVSMRLASIEIPNAWYLFSTLKKNNTFVVEINNEGVTTSYDIIIPDGNYDNSMLESYLNTTYFYQSTTISDLNNIKFSIDPFSFKSKFEIVGVHPDLFCVTIIFYDNINDNFMNTFGWIIGFRLAKYKNISTFIISEGLYDAGGDRYIYVSVEDYQYNTNSLNIVCFDQSILEKNIIAKIPMVNGKLSMIVDDNTSPLTKTRRYNGPVNIRNLHIKIMDQFGNIIDLNNMDYSFTLELEILYEGFNFDHINS
jgi:hypothetical protein